MSLTGAPDIGIIIPTLGTRTKYLNDAINSIRDAGDAFIAIVHPRNVEISSDIKEQVNLCLVEPGEGQASAINFGVDALPDHCKFVNWLGDDDLLEKDTLLEVKKPFFDEPKTVAVFGKCKYIDKSGNLIGINRSGSWVVPLLKFGPDLLPQPGALIRREAFNHVGKLDTKYKFAFDHDLFIRLSKVGRVKYIKLTLASFRWHTESLTVFARVTSVAEASAVRKSHSNQKFSILSTFLESLVKFFTLKAGKLVSLKSKLQTRKNEKSL